MIDSVICQYPKDCQPSAFQSLGNAGGFSGARLWRLQTPLGELCLRRWPKSTSHKRISFIQLIVSRAHQAGCEFVPRAILSKSKQSWVRCDGAVYELTYWMPGDAALSPTATASFNDTKKSQSLAAASLRSLAKFHVAAASLDDVVDTGISRGLQNRIELTERLLHGELDELESRSCSEAASLSNPYSQKLQTILQLAKPRIVQLPKLLQPARQMQFSLQPCIRDVWYDHVLFEDERVTGLIDFGALQANETVACDIARLLTSVEGHVHDTWNVGVAAYEEVRQLTANEKDALALFRQSTIALSGLSWARWLLLERRHFENEERVCQRLDEIIGWLALV